MDCTVSVIRDRVIWAFTSRLYILHLQPDAARRLAGATRVAARDAELWERSGGRSELIRGEERGALVRSWNGLVNVVLASVVDRESIPWKAALKVADELEVKVVEAENKVTILWAPTETLKC